MSSAPPKKSGPPKGKSSPPESYAATVPPPAALDAPGAEYRLLVKEMAALNAKFDHLTKPPAFRIADVVGLGGALIALAAFTVSAFALSDRIAQSEDRIGRVQQTIAEDVKRTRDDVAAIATRAAVLEDRAKRTDTPR